MPSGVLLEAVMGNLRGSVMLSNAGTGEHGEPSALLQSIVGPKLFSRRSGLSGLVSTERGLSGSIELVTVSQLSAANSDMSVFVLRPCSGVNTSGRRNRLLLLRNRFTSSSFRRVVFERELTDFGSANPHDQRFYTRNQYVSKVDMFR